MNAHKNARLTPLGRERIVRQVASGHSNGLIDIAAKDRRDCRIAPGRIGCTGQRPRRLLRRSNVAFVQVVANQRKESAVAFLEAAVAYYAKLGIRIERVMTDNGSCIDQRLSELPASTLAFAKSSPSPTLHEPMARPSALRPNRTS